jgi:hypothetical protein
MSKLAPEIDKRRTFAIISHPDAGVQSVRLEALRRVKHPNMQYRTGWKLRSNVGFRLRLR